MPRRWRSRRRAASRDKEARGRVRTRVAPRNTAKKAMLRACGGAASENVMAFNADVAQDGCWKHANAPDEHDDGRHDARVQACRQASRVRSAAVVSSGSRSASAHEAPSFRKHPRRTQARRDGEGAQLGVRRSDACRSPAAGTQTGVQAQRAGAPPRDAAALGCEQRGARVVRAAHRPPPASLRGPRRATTPATRSPGACVR